MKIKETENKGVYFFYCQGCNSKHFVNTNFKENSLFNGSILSPTFERPINISFINEKGIIQRCDSFIQEGIIKYLPNCTHSLKNHSIKLPNII